jgi:ankyrin repeat protein
MKPRLLLVAGLTVSAFAATRSLRQAAEAGDVASAKNLIAAGTDVSEADRYGVTPLYVACTNGNTALVDLLLKAGADPNTAQGEGETVLMAAARTGQVEIVQRLLAAGAKVDTKETWRGQTALMWAAAEGHVPVVKALLAAKADPALRSNAGFTAFLFAARDGRADVAKALLEAGVSPNEALTQTVRRPATNALGLAVTNGHFELASMLLDAGADPNAGANGWTALHTITWVRKPGTGSNDPAPDGSGKMDSLELVKRLVAKGADVNARTTKNRAVGMTSLNTEGATPFLLAARTGDAELMRLLAKLGADPLIPTTDGSTPLMVAAGVGTRSPGEDAGTEEECLEAVKVAFELGGDVNAVDKNGETAMHGAAYKWMPTVAQFLGDHGAKPEIWNRKNSHGWTPLRIADGVHRGMNLRRSPETAVVLRKFLTAAGMSTEVEPETNISGATK